MTEPPVQAAVVSPYHHGDLKRALVVAAARLIEQGEATALSLRGIARQVGVSHVAIYRHFADKAAFQAAVVASWNDELGERVRRAAAAAPHGDPRARLMRMLDAWMQFVVKVPSRFRLMVDHDPPLTEASPILRLVAEEILRGQQAGGLRAGNPGNLAQALVVAAYGYADLALRAQLPPSAATLEVLLRPALDGLSVTRTDRAPAPRSRLSRA